MNWDDIGQALFGGSSRYGEILQLVQNSVWAGAVLGIVGGLIGIVVGCAASYAIASTGAVQTTITLAPILLSFSFAVGIGLFFGIYPARKAARLEPIEALRYD